MKLKIMLVSLVAHSFLSAQTGTPPAANTNAEADAAWYRGGNNPIGSAGANNIFGTMWNSSIYVFTNSRNTALFSSSNSLNGIIGSGDGLRINNMDPNAPVGTSLGQIDIFTSGSNSTEIRFGGSGNIVGGFNRFEIHGNYQGVFVNASQGGYLEFARSGTVTAFVGNNNYWRIGTQPDAANLQGNRRLEVVDGSYQFRLSHTNANYTDFFSNSFGNLQILPIAGRVGINLGTNPTEALDVEGNGRFRYLPLPSNEASTTLNKVVMVDENGVLRWRDASDFGTLTGASNGAWVNGNNQVEWGTNGLTHNTVVPMVNSKVLFSTGLASPNTFTIGGGTYSPNSRLYVDNDILGTGAFIKSYSWDGSMATSRSGVIAYAYDAKYLTGSYGFAKTGEQIQGVFGSALNGSKTTMGVRGFGSSTVTSSINYGGNFEAAGGSIYENIGVSGYANGSIKSNYGGKFKAGNTGNFSIGVYGESTPGFGVTQYAGYFVGDVIATSYITFVSDQQFKTNVTTIPSALKIVSNLNPKMYYMDTLNYSQFNFGSEQQYGFIAQEVEHVLPSIVFNGAKPAEYDSLGNEISPMVSFKSLNYNAIIPINTQAIKELNTKVDKTTLSDQSLKTNVADLTGSLDKVLEMRGVTYEWDQSVHPELGLDSNAHVGFIAQEIHAIDPTLTFMDEDTLMHVEYDKVVPILAEAIEELNDEVVSKDSIIDALTQENLDQQAQINDLNARLTQLENCLSNLLPALCQANQMSVQQTPEETQKQLEKTINVTLSNRNNIVLNQNVPNPFAESTVITYSIAATVQKAQIHFYDGTGKLISSVDITERGQGQLNVFANDLSTGVYTYTLVADGQIVATKRMMKE